MEQNPNLEFPEEFLGGERIHQAGEFLPQRGSEIAGNEEAEREIRESAEAHFKDVAQIAALERHPGFKALMDKIDTMVEGDREEQESLAAINKLTLEKSSMNLYAIVRLKELKKWLHDQISEYKEMIQDQRGE